MEPSSKRLIGSSFTMAFVNIHPELTLNGSALMAEGEVREAAITTCDFRAFLFTKSLI